jgi:hypothetical protein
MGGLAIDLLREGQSGVAVGLRGVDLVTTPLSEVIVKHRELNRELYELALTLAI